MSRTKEVRALRVVYGVPKDSSSVEKMERWVKRHCLDYRREDDGDQVVMTMVLHDSRKGYHIYNLVSHHVQRWGFARRHGQRLLEPISIESYMEGGVGARLKDRVRELLGSSSEKVEQKAQGYKKQRVKQNHWKARARRFKAFSVRPRASSLPVVELYMKAMWDVAKRLLGKADVI